MKALQSKLASELLADPTARAQLRDFLVNRNVLIDAQGTATAQRFFVQHPDGTRYEVKIVPKATSAS